MQKLNRAGIAITVLALTLFACGGGGASATVPPPPSGDQVSTVVASTMQALTPNSPASPVPQPSGLLPHSLYFLNNDNAGFVQVFRLGTDGKTLTQITFEPGNVDSYDVSRVNGNVAYVSNNQFLLVNADGSGRRLLLDGGAIDSNAPYITEISAPVFSPDGQTVAFGYQGLNFYSVASGQINLVLKNEYTDMGGGNLIVKALYRPEMYVPDGSKLILTIGHYEGGTTAVYSINGGNLTRMSSDQRVVICCGDYSVSADGSSLYTGSRTFGMFPAGLWRMDLNSGAITTLFTGDFDTNPADVSDDPFIAPDGQLYYFYASVPNTGDTVDRPALQLVRSAPDGVTNRTVLRAETFESMNEALWAPDASFVIVETAPIDQVTQGGLIELYYIDGQKDMISLAPFGMRLKWGP